MIVGDQTEARAQPSSTIIDYHEPFDQGFKAPANGSQHANATYRNIKKLMKNS